MGTKIKAVFHKGIEYDIEKVGDHYVVVNTQRPMDNMKARKGPEFEMGKDFNTIEEAESFIKLT